MSRKPLKALAIYLRGHNLNPDSITQVLHIQPTRTQKKGELKQGSSRFIAKIGLWALGVKSESQSIPELLDSLLIELANVPMRLDELPGVEEACLDLFVTLSSQGRISDSLEWIFTQQQVATLNRLGLSVCFTIT